MKLGYCLIQIIVILGSYFVSRWKYNEEKNEWIGVFAQTVWKLRQENNQLLYEIIGSNISSTQSQLVKNLNIKASKHKSIDIKAENAVFHDLLKKYFQLDIVLSDYYEQWAKKDELFKSACQQFYGVRLLNQDPVENLFSFICSQNNHISRYCYFS